MGEDKSALAQGGAVNDAALIRVVNHVIDKNAMRKPQKLRIYFLQISAS